MKLLASVCLALTVAAVSVPSYAAKDSYEKPGSRLELFKKKLKDNKQSCGRFSCKDTKTKPVPEIDVAGAGVALALLGGVAAMAGERRRQKLQA